MIFVNKIELLNKIATAKLISSPALNIALFLHGLEHNLSENENEILATITALLYEWVSSGSICITKEDIRELAEKGKNDLLDISFPDWKQITEILEKSSCCTSDPISELKPIVISGDKIYSYKYWLQEESLAKKVFELSKLEGKYAEKASDIEKVFEELFDDPKSFEQKKAAETVIQNRFSVITGGPGTGKTTTVAKIIAGILSEYPEERIVLAAPTGKAAARMTEALVKTAKNNIKRSVSEEIFSKITLLEGVTIHRILEKKFGKAGKNRLNPIFADLVIIDEASMVDITVFSELLDALSDETSLVLLGDKDQLASVDAGNVFSDICDAAENNLFDRNIMTKLTKSRRFDENSGIGRLAKAVNEQKNCDEIVKICEEEPDIVFIEANRENWTNNVLAEIKEKYKFLFDKSLDPEAILAKLNNFKILCPSREDFFGVVNINCEIESAFGIDPKNTFYNGRPIMITKNDYANGLMNGDCGVILKRNGKTMAYFPNNELSPFEITMLPAFETVYAMTIHKSQGSEYSFVLVVMPERDMPMLTKELLYTAITRVKKDANSAKESAPELKIAAKKSVLEYTLKNSASRNSGFKKALVELKANYEE